MDEAELAAVERLRGVHAYDRGTRAGNWVAIWVFVALSLGVGGVAEAYLRGWQTIRLTPFLEVACGLAAVAGWAWIRAFNRTSYHVEDGSIQCVTAWPRRGWKLCVEEIETLQFEPSHGRWSLQLHLRGGARKRMVLTRSMTEALGLP